MSNIILLDFFSLKMEVKNYIKATLYHTTSKTSTMNKMASTESGIKSGYYND